MSTVRRPPPPSYRTEPVTLALFLLPVLVFVGVAYVLYAGHVWSVGQIQMPGLPASLQWEESHPVRLAAKATATEVPADRFTAEDRFAPAGWRPLDPIPIAATPAPRPPAVQPPAPQSVVAGESARVIAPGEPAAVATPGPPPAVARVGNSGGTGVYLRKEPNSTLAILLREGTKVELLGEETKYAGYTWAKAREPTGQVGWIATKYLVR